MQRVNQQYSQHCNPKSHLVVKQLVRKLQVSHTGIVGPLDFGHRRVSISSGLNRGNLLYKMNMSVQLSLFFLSIKVLVKGFSRLELYLMCTLLRFVFG